ncbi:hypothetical protein C922_05218 [Plasmodium inui San Antonio 1]|uniref:Uncharacterized protein n=1 Tax=Plasmodium inui San Antonio 1 TaxID=1237626 RepID=W6ZTX7_9APIC|nr:hypothetical protein C922_05218 [Plasmodium inui San Antonio 1]EUD64397.1 hypothetical protein C922_05218 [Plasmodium inui San Antonio 1]
MITLEVMKISELIRRLHNNTIAISRFLIIENPDTSVLFRQKFLNIHALHITVLHMNLGDALALETHTQVFCKENYPWGLPLLI